MFLAQLLFRRFAFLPAGRNRNLQIANEPNATDRKKFDTAVAEDGKLGLQKPTF
ncbi:hypothetical protein V7x_40520 [Crateriforma conspicua]|uniref:Uncharacterized protein n=1 Tax=Crateriforma conspicua TaxID=2527996 RepID=A0A5C6FPJ2_9PLAN|nr:hypothetical protein V7x_40520 [Crateriforma conspicua]